MKKLILFVTAVILYANLSYATPSTTYWTPTTTYMQPYGVGHITYDTYFFMGDKTAGGGLPDLPVNYGLLLGVLPSNSYGIQAEIGFDYLSMGKLQENIFLNGKIGVTEDKYPVAVQIGFFSYPLKAVKDTNDYNVIHAVVGKTMGPLWIGAGYYMGNKVLGTDKSGLGLGATYYLFGGQTYQLTADYYTGKNGLGGGGIGLYWYFAPGADLLVGPVFYNDESINGKMKWTVQIDIDFDVFSKK